MFLSLEHDVLLKVVEYINDPKDLFNFFYTCRQINECVSTKCFDITIYIDNADSLIFLRKIKQLRRIQIFRRYNNLLDLSPLLVHKNLYLLYINSPRKIINIPPAKNLLYSFERLYSSIRIKSKSLEDSDDEEQHPTLIDIKEYFTSRFHMKKVSKLRIKQREFSGNYLPCSL